MRVNKTMRKVGFKKAPIPKGGIPKGGKIKMGFGAINKPKNAVIPAAKMAGTKNY